MSKLGRERFRYIEEEVKAYPETCGLIERMSAREATYVEAHLGTMATRLVVAKDVSDRLSRRRAVIDAIGRVYADLADERKRLVEIYYWNRGDLLWDGVAHRLCVSRATAFRWRDAFIEAVDAAMTDTTADMVTYQLQGGRQDGKR